MLRLRDRTYVSLGSTDGSPAQTQDYSIELHDFDSRQERKNAQDNDDRYAPMERHQTRVSITSKISNPFRDPEVEVDDHQLQALRPHQNRRNIVGWRMGTIVSACTAGSVFIINLIFFIAAITAARPKGGIGTLHQGNCSTVRRLDTTIHLALNVLGVMILSASNYTAQCLSSPTRHEIDRAHAKRKALDIGIPSAFNLIYMSWTKRLLWSFLMLSTLPLHLLWNSSVFSSIQSNEYVVIVGTPDFINNGTTICTNNKEALDSDLLLRGNCSIVDFVRNGYYAGNYTEMTPRECIKNYAQEFLTSHRNVIAIMDTASSDANYFLWPDLSSVDNNYEGIFPGYFSSMPESMKNSTAVNGTTLLSVFENPDLTVGWPVNNSYSAPNYQWLCNYYKYRSCTEQSAQQFSSSWHITPAMYPISTCYSEKVREVCKLEYSSLLVSIVLICNGIKTTCMVLTAWKIRRLDNPILVTVGEAASSFLERPDETTKGSCLLDRDSLQGWKSHTVGVKWYRTPKALRFFNAVSTVRWVMTFIFCFTFIGYACYLVQQAIYNFPNQSMKSGFGKINPNAVYYLPINYYTDDISFIIIISVLVANLPQLVLSISYFIYNSLLTIQISAHEWSLYALKKTPLRVTFPRGNQISTYWLQLPFWYSVPLSGFLALLHYLISQSLFLANVEYYDPMGNLDSSNYMPGLGYSPVAILISFIMWIALVLALGVNGFRKLDSKMLLMGNCSAAISAACHPDPSEPQRKLIPFKKIKWGVVKNPGGPGDYGHCTFSTLDVDLPVPGELYE